jgi:hypothetical protein
LNFELDTYLDALKTFPKQDLILRTEKGEAVFVKMDIFKNHLWYTYKEERFKWFRLTLEQVLEIVDLNKNNEKSASLEEYESDVEAPVKVDFEDAVGQDSLTRFDVPRTNKRRRNTKNNKKKPVSELASNVKQKHNSRNKPQAQQQNKPNPRPRSKPSPSADQPKGEAKKINKPRRKTNRNRNNNTPKNGSDSEK